MSLKHAKHNEGLCNQLFSEKNYFDWVVTTAFYTALHYSEYELFPLMFGPTEYESFDIYYPSFKKLNDDKHQARKRLIYSNLSPKAGSAYNWLMDNCWTARYYDYETKEEDADTAMSKLSIIKAELKKSLS